MKVVLASKNQHKLVEMRDILAAQGVEVVLESEVGADVEVEETGTTFEENSLLKARAVMECTGLPSIADDSGLVVDALNGAPGVYSARYGGEGLDDVGRYRLLLENMRGQLDRTCRFVSVITLCMPNGDVITARGECPGKKEDLRPAHRRGKERHLPSGECPERISNQIGALFKWI